MRDLEGWMLGYLLNSLWQAPLIVAAGWMAARMARRMGPEMEHRAWVSALLLEAALPACRFGVGGWMREVWALLLGGPATAGGDVRYVVSAGGALGAGVLRIPQEALAAIAAAYGCGLLYFAGRLGWRLWLTHRMEREAEPVTLTGEALRQWERCGRESGYEGAKLAVSPRIAGPVTVGIRRGMMLVPPGFLEGLAEEDLGALVAHEFAHMRRRDFVKNLVYGALSVPVAYHPVVWLTRSRVAESREMVCDAMAAAAVAGRERYARSLLRLASLLVKGRPVKTLHAIGIFDANSFERRVMNLTEGRVEIRGLRRCGLAAACVVVGVVTCGSAMALRMDVAGPAAQSANAARPKVPAREMSGLALAIDRKNPVYPAKARADKDTVDGPVILAMTVGKDGVPRNVHVTKSLRPDYDESALTAVRQWRWHPYRKDGRPVAVDTTVTVTYSLAP